MAIEINRTTSLDAPLAVSSLRGVGFTHENEAHKFIITCTRNGEEVTLAGAVTARFIRADGTTVYEAPADVEPTEEERVSTTLTSIEDGKAVVILHKDCYNVAGRFQLAIFNVDNGATVCVYACVGTIQRSQVGDLIDSGEVFNPDDWTDEIATLRTLITQTETAKDDAIAAAQHSVRFDTTQTLTDTQKTTARTNMGVVFADDGDGNITMG